MKFPEYAYGDSEGYLITFGPKEIGHYIQKAIDHGGQLYFCKDVSGYVSAVTFVPMIIGILDSEDKHKLYKTAVRVVDPADLHKAHNSAEVFEDNVEALVALNDKDVPF